MSHINKLNNNRVLKRCSLSSRFSIFFGTAFPAVISIILLLVVVFLLLIPWFENQIIAQKKNTLRELGVTAINVIKEYHRLELSRELSHEEAQQKAISMIDSLRYGRDIKEYFWIQDMQANIIAHPYRVDLIGSNLSLYTDSKGNQLFADTVNMVREHDNGYINYRWQMHSEVDHVTPKTSYVIGFKPWGWIVGTGMYLGDVELQIAKTTWDIIQICILGIGFIAILILYLSYRITYSSEKLKESENRLKNILNATTQTSIITTDVNGMITDVNVGFERMLGYTREELVGKYTPAKFHLESEISDYACSMSDRYGSQLSGISIFIEEVKRTGFETREWTYVKKNGDLIPVSLSFTAIHNYYGEIIGYLGIAYDISDRKRVEESLRESEQILNMHFQQTPLGVIEWSPDFRVLKWNPAAENIFGYSSDEVLGCHANDFLVPDDVENIDKKMNALFKNIGGFRSTNKNLTKDGNIITCEWYNTPLIDDHGQVIRVASLARDITKRVEAEKGNALLESQLRQSQKMESIGTLAGGIAHDFNNILFGALGFTELARKKSSANSDVSSYLDQVITSLHRAAELVKQILTFSRQSEQLHKPLLIQLIIKEALKLMRSSFPSTIEIVQNIDAECPSIMADPTQIHQVVMNLCTNSYHAMHDNGGVLTVELLSVNIDQEQSKRNINFQPGKYVFLHIADTGCGIEKSVLKRIFEPYYTTKKTGEGTGLGLSTVHGIVKNLNGVIEVNSQIGVGTDFKLYFPVNISSNDVTRDVEDDAIIETTENERILVVDDEISIVNLLQKLLGNLGYTVQTFTNSQDAFNSFIDDPSQYDLLITDQTMPHITGGELAKRILEIRPDFPIILCTGYSDVLTKELAGEIGISEYIQKPIHADKLAISIRKLINKNS